MSETLSDIYRDLIGELDAMAFGPPVVHVYNPLKYAGAAHAQYLDRFGAARGRVLLLGMNPGPWGMAQTGVPFGEVAHVRDWIGIDAPIGKPDHEHPKRPILGWGCHRNEVSGARLWGWAKDAFGTPEAFFERFFIANYCPLIFLEETGRNRVPEKLPKAEREPLFAACDRALARVVAALAPSYAVGVGAFAEKRLAKVLGGAGLDVPVGRVPHPSPASPLANKGWAPLMDAALADMGVATSA